ncbi:MAG: flagellar assembly peptidoglycan hydrolase FlgJ [Vogesella sp.]|uniref:flagellar assembly peptidoglycan hydrolase FlgJ n=1 Tax=Vogesella sp. TaxID=1904252 RepID=UPI0039195D33
MINPAATANRLVMDPEATRSLSELARKDPQAAVKQVAGQFEALLMSQLMSSMRASSLDDEDASQEMDTYRGMYDQQVVQTMVNAGGFGLAESLSKYLLKAMPQQQDAESAAELAAAAPMPPLPASVRKAVDSYAAMAPQANIATTSGKDELPAGKQAFVEALLPHARPAAARLGVAPEVLVGHAALESGWGQRAIRHPDGRHSYNLFGIKATPSWKGDVVATLTTEYEGGVAQKQVDSFRAYPSLQAAFDDYARLLADSPRYQQALNQGQNAAAFATALQRGGYATDPAYAQKLQAVIRTVSNS